MKSGFEWNWKGVQSTQLFRISLATHSGNCCANKEAVIDCLIDRQVLLEKKRRFGTLE
jgi:hypothetical protein